MCDKHIQGILHSGYLLNRPILLHENWDCLLEQAYITLKLICPSRMNPKISLYTQLNVTFEYNRTPMALPGTITLVHKNRTAGTPGRHTSTKDGIYVGLCYIIDVLHHKYPRQYCNDSPKQQNSYHSRRNSQAFPHQMQ